METMMIDCQKCGARHDWVMGDKNKKCKRCTTLAGDEVQPILQLMREMKYPGQEEIIHVLDVLDKKLSALGKKPKT